MQNNVLEPGGMSMEEARAMRLATSQAAQWLQAVWADAPTALAWSWEALAQLPTWALRPRDALARLALLCGAVFAAPTLRLCLDAGALRRVQALIGAQALERVLAMDTSNRLEEDRANPQGDEPARPGQLNAVESPPWPAQPEQEREALYRWGALLLIATVEHVSLQVSLLRALGLSETLLSRQGRPPLVLAQRLSTLALALESDLSNVEEVPT